MSRDEAVARAREEFGDLEFTRDYCRRVDEVAERETRMTDRLAGWAQDARYTLRTVRRSPGFAAVALLTLALAIGANAAIFAVARAVLIAPLPYGSPGSLLGGLRELARRSGRPLGDFPTQLRRLPSAAARVHRPGRLRRHGELTWRTTAGEPEMLSSVAVTPNLFTVLQCAGRCTGEPSHPAKAAAGNDRVALVSYRTWHKQLGGDLSAIGKPIMLNGRPYTLIGVMPPRFTLGLDEDVWTPNDFHEEMANVGGDAPPALRARRRSDEDRDVARGGSRRSRRHREAIGSRVSRRRTPGARRSSSRYGRRWPDRSRQRSCSCKVRR